MILKDTPYLWHAHAGSVVAGGALHSGISPNRRHSFYPSTGESETGVSSPPSKQVLFFPLPLRSAELHKVLGAWGPYYHHLFFSFFCYCNIDVNTPRHHLTITSPCTHSGPGLSLPCHDRALQHLPLSTGAARNSESERRWEGAGRPRTETRRVFSSEALEQRRLRCPADPPRGTGSSPRAARSREHHPEARPAAEPLPKR